MKDYSKHIELAIPDNIRLGEHSDAKLITSLIATLVVAFEEADDIWAKNRMAKVNAAIAAWDKAEFTPHIAKEDEDWNSLKAQIEQNKAEVETHKATVESAVKRSEEDSRRIAELVKENENRKFTLFATVYKRRKRGDHPREYAANVFESHQDRASKSNSLDTVHLSSDEANWLSELKAAFPEADAINVVDET